MKLVTAAILVHDSKILIAKRPTKDNLVDKWEFPGGPDDPNWVIALCPNCHREAHYGQNRADYNQRLTFIVRNIEA